MKVSEEELLEQIKLSGQFRALTEQAVAQKIIQAKATEENIDVPAEELQQEADRFREENQLLSAEATQQWLQKRGLSLEEFEKLIYRKTLNQKLAEHLFSDQVEPYFYSNQTDYMSALIDEAIFDNQDLTLEFFYEIQEGERSFWEIAHQYISDPELRRCGGYRGKIYRSQMKPEISAAVFSAAPPQILQPITTSQGYHLIFVEKVIQPQLDEELRLKIQSELFNQWLKEEISKTNIEVTNNHE